MALFFEIIDVYSGLYKKGVFGKKYTIQFTLYKDRILANGFNLVENEISENSYERTIPMQNLISIYQKTIKNEVYLCLDYIEKNILNTKTATVILPGIPNVDTWINKAGAVKDEFDQQERLKKDRVLVEKKAKELEEESVKKFYNDCYNFHIKANTPKYPILTESNKVILIYIDEYKNLNFLKIDGYTREENNNVILNEDIHYYEVAGNIQYLSEINGDYQSAGLNVTGANISKFATVGGGLLFGTFGMMMGAALTYKPSKITTGDTSFQISSEVKKIDDRSVVLNFFSQPKKEYIDIELPKEMYNFLQTYLPEKKYDIVMELEKKTIIHQSANLIESGQLLKNSTAPLIEEKVQDNMSEFKLKVEKLKIMKDAGLLTEEEFNLQKNKLLESIL